MGVWIETTATVTLIAVNKVTPYVGVWIETRLIYVIKHCVKVTPYVGVWIETSNFSFKSSI